jgi:hypothetical protein
MAETVAPTKPTKPSWMDKFRGEMPVKEGVNEESWKEDPYIPRTETPEVEPDPEMDVMNEADVTEPSLPDLETTKSMQTQRKIFRPEDAKNMEAGVKNYSDVLNKPDTFDASAQRKDLLNEYTKGMGKAERIQFINAIAENLGKIVSGGVGLATQSDVAKGFSYKGLNPEDTIKNAESAYATGSKDLDRQYAENTAKRTDERAVAKSGLDMYRQQGLDNASDVANTVNSDSRYKVGKDRYDSDMALKMKVMGSAAAVVAGKGTANVGQGTEDKKGGESVKSISAEELARRMNEVRNTSADFLGAQIQGGGKNRVKVDSVEKAIFAAKKDPKNPQKLEDAFDEFYGWQVGVARNLSMLNSKEYKDSINKHLGYLAELKNANLLTADMLGVDVANVGKVADAYSQLLEGKTGETLKSTNETTNKEDVNLKMPMSNAVPTPEAPTPPTPVAIPPDVQKNYATAKGILAAGNKTDPKYAKAVEYVATAEKKYPSLKASK